MTKAPLSRYAWPLAAAVMLGALWLALWFQTEFCIRIIGLLLQLLGIGTAFWGIISLISRALMTGLGLPRHIVCELSTVEFALMWQMRGSTQPLAQDPTPQLRPVVDALEKNVTAMDERITKEIEEQSRIIDDIMKHEEQSRREE